MVECGNDRRTENPYEKCATRKRAAERRKSRAAHPPATPDGLRGLAEAARADWFARSGGE